MKNKIVDLKLMLANFFMEIISSQKDILTIHKFMKEKNFTANKILKWLKTFQEKSITSLF